MELRAPVRRVHTYDEQGVGRAVGAASQPQRTEQLQ